MIMEINGVMSRDEVDSRMKSERHAEPGYPVRRPMALVYGADLDRQALSETVCQACRAKLEFLPYRGIDEPTLYYAVAYCNHCQFAQEF